MKRILTGLLLAILAAPALADEPANYRHLMPLLPQHEGGQHRLVLPAEVYLHAGQAGLADLRIFNASRESLPFAFSAEPADPPPQPAQQILNWFALPGSDTRDEDVRLTVRLQPDGALTATRERTPRPAQVKRYLIDASQLKQPVQALEINAAGTPDDTLHHLTLEASDDLKNWRTLTNHAPWLDLHSDSSQLTLKRVEFAPLRSKYFRLSWEDAPVPVKQVVAETAADEAPAHYLQHTLTIRQRDTSRNYEFELPPALCLERLRLILPQPDSIAPVSILARQAEDRPWQTVASATFYRISRDGSELTSPAHALPGIRARYWRIHLDHAANTPPATLQLEIGWRSHQLVFLASGSAPYTLAFGNNKARSASLPLTTLLPDYRAGDELKLPLATTGALVSHETVGGDSSADKLQDMEWKSLLLWTILIAGVALLGWMAWNIKKGLNRPTH